MKSKGTGGENGKRRGELDRERKQSQNMPFIAVFCPCFFHREPGPGMAHSWGRAWGWGGDWQADSGLSRGWATHLVLQLSLAGAQAVLGMLDCRLTWK